ncbi:hypothetical protein [Caulobacter hibisci]|uniref:Uncharacterized protein n=1 Tax=Caulobacter hibisci TaxID=2035993 RepID=A0ABS0T183_9CAUL|nr:hypothetical protein [Caulobacter hibisci]MBI1685631.1 hypothetical protein [Caulobacter hibisci]
MVSSAVSRRAVLAFAAAPLVLAAAPAFARSDKKKEKKEGGEGEKEAPDPVIKLGSMALPIVAEGRLINYVFVDLSLTLPPEGDVTVFAGKEPFLRDALVRAAHKQPFNKPGSYVLLDEAKLKSTVMREVTTLVGKGKVASVTIGKQTPRNFVPPPKPAPKPGTPAQAKPAPRVDSAPIIP